MEYYHDDSAPPPNSMTPPRSSRSATTTGRLLLVRRSDSGNWELPGGRVELGETAPAAAEREVVEESESRSRPPASPASIPTPCTSWPTPTPARPASSSRSASTPCPLTANPTLTMTRPAKPPGSSRTVSTGSRYIPACAPGSSMRSPNPTHPTSPDLEHVGRPAGGVSRLRWSRSAERRSSATASGSSSPESTTPKQQRRPRVPGTPLPHSADASSSHRGVARDSPIQRSPRRTRSHA